MMRVFLALMLSLVMVTDSHAAELVQDHLVVPTRSIRAKTLIGPNDITLIPGRSPGMISDPNAVIGQEARVTLFAGRPIHLAQLTSAALVERNEIIVLSYNADGLYIETEGRALERGTLGDRIRVMNLTSRMTVSATITAVGRVEAGG